MQKNLTIFISIASILLLPSIAYAQTHSPANTPVTNTTVSIVPTALTVVSDYALDVQQGKQSVNNDAEAQNNQKEVAENENIEAHEETEAVEPKEEIEPEEAKEPDEAIEPQETESEKGKSGGESNAEGSKQESDSNSDSNKQSDGENKQKDNDNNGKSVEGARTQKRY